MGTIISRKGFLTILTVGVISFAVFGYYIFRAVVDQSSASAGNILDTTNISEESGVEKATASADISLYKDDGYLYKTQSSGDAGVIEFLSRDIRYSAVTPTPVESKVGLFSRPFGERTATERLIPQNFLQNSSLSRKVSDKDGVFENLDADHYFYSQKIDTIPVLGAQLAVHLKNEKEIYALDGNLALSNAIARGTLSEVQAREIALEQAREDYAHNDIIRSDTPSAALRTLELPDFPIDSVRPTIINKSILGIDDDEVNYLTYGVTVVVDKDPVDFSMTYYISQVDGNILYKISHVRHALSRTVYNCRAINQRSSCPVVRQEGSAASGESESDRTYDIFGDIYQYLFTTFQRDSYDGRGSILQGYTHVNRFTQCPNAFWTGASREAGYMSICDGMVANDVVGHEVGHGLIHSSVDFYSSDQQGALDASIADMSGYAIVRQDWSFGEDPSLGVVRKMDDPPNMAYISGKQRVNCDYPYADNPNGLCYKDNCQGRSCYIYHISPDRLFSPFYYCGYQDFGGVHYNNGVTNKAFYLMTEGGSFNGCTVSGIGKERSMPIIYRALTVYLRANSNYKDFYTAVMQSCVDLYQSGSQTCINVRKTLQATELDQQDTRSNSPLCRNVQPQRPACANEPSPTATSIPPTSTPIPPTSTPVPPTATIIPSSTPTPRPTNTPTPTRAPTPVPPTPTRTPTPIPPTNTPVPSPSPTLISTSITPPGSTNTPTPAGCPGRNEGDADCNGAVNLTDFEIWRGEYLGEDSTQQSDFDGDGRVTLTDFEIWRGTYLR